MTNDPNPNNAEQFREVRENRQPGSYNREEVVIDAARERRVLLNRLSQLIWLLGGALMVLLGIRFILKLIAANPANPFAVLVYRFTDLFLWPFFGLTVTPQSGGIVLEIYTLIAIAIYALITWAVVKLLWVIFAPSRTRQVTSYHQEQQ